MRSDAVKKGMQQAPHRSLFHALGMTKEEMEKPLVGIVSSYNEIVPGIIIEKCVTGRIMICIESGKQQRTVSVAQKPEIMAQCIIINPSPVSFHKGGNQ